MRCPACQQALHEHAPVCPHCGFTLLVAERYFGIPPQVKADITDLANVLSKKEKRDLQQLLRVKRLRFPQARFAVVMDNVTPEVPLGSYAFWLFNKSGLASAMQKAGDCHLILLVFDVENHRCTGMVGYGLEPFVSEEILARILDAGMTAFQEGRFTDSIKSILHQADIEFTALCNTIPKTYGLTEEMDPALEAGAYAY